MKICVLPVVLYILCEVRITKNHEKEQLHDRLMATKDDYP
jgi:hypothetical protein